jgi:hypothetical protein
MSKARNQSKREQAAVARAEFQKKKRRNAIITRLVIAAVVLLTGGAIVRSVIRDRDLTASVTTSTYPAGIHRSGQITYAETPPVGGAHHVVWQNCGIYDAPIHEEHGVHALEHGAVWITYRPGLPADQVEQLRTLARDDYMLLSPFPGLPSPVVLSAWNHQLRLDRVDDPKLRAFISRYKNNPSTTPEFGASCAGGTSAPATAATLGATVGPPMRP